MFQSDISKKYIGRINSLDIKEFILIIILGLFLTDIVTFLDIHGLREILTFLYLTIVPGTLIIQIFRLNKLKFLNKFVLSIGLSLSTVMFMGFVVNSFYPLILKPLSLFPLVISFNIVILILSLIAYNRNKKDFEMTDLFNFKIDTKGKLVSPMIISILFPFMAIFGTIL